MVSPVVATLTPVQPEETKQAAEIKEIPSSEVKSRTIGLGDESSTVLPPLSIYQKEKGHPYSVDYFNIDYWDQLNGELDIDKIRDKVGLIETWVEREIKQNKLEDSLESYKQIIKEMESELAIKPTEKLESKLERLAAYIAQLWKQEKGEIDGNRS